MAASSRRAIFSKSASNFSSIGFLHFTLANHPGLQMPRAATSWSSCQFAVSYWYIMYRKGTLSSIKKPAEAGSLGNH
ncbi:hypothetical protein FPB06_21540 [Enterobacter hormaechei]|nr:hypothetical protein FPB06_21540 [Enterobacter hormaechei]TSD23478.1 hypothetical protein FPB07_07410 [Enterobacter hormaechei]